MDLLQLQSQWLSAIASPAPALELAGSPAWEQARDHQQTHKDHTPDPLNKTPIKEVAE